MINKRCGLLQTGLLAFSFVIVFILVSITLVHADPIATDDAFTVNSFTGGVTSTVFNNDTLNGLPFAPGDVTATITADPDGTGTTINPDGTLYVPPGVSAGTHAVTYQICDNLNLLLCDTAIVTLTVTAAPTNAIAGTVFNDIDGDGARDPDEPGINGVTVLLYDSIGTTLHWSTVTIADGTYVFTSLVPGGVYDVVETDPSGYLSTTLNTVDDVIVPAGAAAMANFGDQQQVKSPRRAIKCVSSCTACNDTCAPVPQFATIPDSASLDLTTTGTIEAWIQATSCTTSDEDAGIVTKGATVATCYGFGLAGGTLFPGGTAQNIGFRLGNDVLTATSHTLVAGKWYHVACVWDAATMRIYINGVLENSGPVTGGGAPVNADALILGRQAITATPVQYFGVIEEFRLWSTTRTQAEIRDNMCKTLILSDADLACYLQYNEDGGAVATDASGNANDADTTNVSQVCSEAPLGDSSDHDYIDDGSYSVAITAGSDTMAADNFTGTWNAASKSGIQIYQVSDTPEPSTGPMETRLFTSRGYWGVFVTGGVDPTYSVTYTYSEIGIGDENNLDLVYRHQGCASWIDLDATLNVVASTLTQTGLEGTEFILGSLVDPRNTIDYDGVDDVVTVSDSVSLDVAAAGSLEAWVYIDNHTPNGGIIHKGDNPDLTDEAYSLNLGPASNTIVFTVRDGVGADTVTSTTVLNTDTWYHVAGVWDDAVSNSMQIYINGVADGAPGVTRTARNSGGGLNIGQQFTVGAGTLEPFDGYIDEVRVWSAALTQAQIQANMCRKLTGAEVGLAGYWRFDDETNLTNCPDYTINNNDGTMSGTFADVRAARICSSAPIGDYSAYNYGAGASTVTLNPTGDPFSVTANGGIWAAGSGIHVYRLDEAPVYGPDLWITAPYTYTTPNGLTPPVNASAPPPNWSSIDYYRYWGVFVTDPTSGVNQPVYDAVYNYNANPMTPQDDSTLGLARRDEFCDRTWSDPGASVTLNTVANTLTFAGDTQNGSPKQNPEYILGGKDDPLAITLASFTAMAVEGCVDISWETATEINTAGFYVWRSDNPLTGFVRLDNSFVSSRSVAETMGAKYTFRDCGVDFTGGKTYYYIIEEIEIDGDGSGNMNGPIGPVSETISAAQSANGSNGSNCFIDSLSWW
ncbi:MAG: LamG-like jellyroll fold domain-containing protein [Desulfosalsimonadaceae bacterium]